jgi:membrane protease YdiL (CAAX protease family)
MVIGRHSSERRRLVGFAGLALVTYVIPVLLILDGIIPVAYRFHTLVTMTVVVAVVARWLGMSRPALGLHLHQLAPALFWNGLLSLLFVVVLVVAYTQGAIRPPTVPQWKLFFIFYVFVSSPCQEFLYRGFLFALMERAGLRGLATQVVLSSVLYSFLHLFYRDWLTMAVTLLMGVVWGLIYARYRNLWPVMGSHAVLGVVSILTGVV